MSNEQIKKQKESRGLIDTLFQHKKRKYIGNNFTAKIRRITKPKHNDNEQRTNTARLSV